MWSRTAARSPSRSDGSISQSARVIASDSKNDLALLTTTGLKPERGAEPAPGRAARRKHLRLRISARRIARELGQLHHRQRHRRRRPRRRHHDDPDVGAGAARQQRRPGARPARQRGRGRGVETERAADRQGDERHSAERQLRDQVADRDELPGSRQRQRARRPPAPAKLDATQIAERARAFTAQIRCN